MVVFAAQNSDSDIVAHSSSGGAFSLLADEIIKGGGVVYGAAFDDKWNIVHKRVEGCEELSLIRGSKYAYSIVGDCYRKAKIDLEEGKKVLFSGTPCQIAAMSKLAENAENLLLVELVCHGAPEHKYWDRYLNEICNKYHCSIDNIENVNFRDKRTGWKDYSFTLKLKKGREITQLHDDNVYMRAFLSDYTLREACFRCPFKYPYGSKADITLGDFWGYQHFEPDYSDDRGVSLVILKTLKGNEFGKRVLKCSKTYTLDQVSKYNQALIKSAVKPENYNEFKNDAETGSLLKVMKRYTRRPLILRMKLHVMRLLGNK